MARNKLFANISFIGTNYTNIVFANPLAIVYAALYDATSVIEDLVDYNLLDLPIEMDLCGY